MLVAIIFSMAEVLLVRNVTLANELKPETYSLKTAN